MRPDKSLSHHDRIAVKFMSKFETNPSDLNATSRKGKIDWFACSAQWPEKYRIQNGTSSA
jgi:hypothetical protein